MFPNPQDALPIPPRPQIEQYKKLAKELAKAVRSSDPNAVAAWFEQWFARLSALADSAQPPKVDFAEEELATSVSRFAEFAKRQTPVSGPGALAAAQFVMAKVHGFQNWARFVETLDRLSHEASTETLFESAADAIIDGDLAKLENLLRQHPELIRARSSRCHGATLLHYVGANGVENYRQKTPPNIVEVAELLLQSGAEVDASAEIYGGGATPFGLVATSGHPERAGVQISLMQRLLIHGANINGSADRSAQPLANVCLANNRVAAAEFLATQGAQMDLASLAGLGRVEEVRAMLDQARNQLPSTGRGPVHPQLAQAFLWACSYNRIETVEYLLTLGLDLGLQDRCGQTALHHAAMNGNARIAGLLIGLGAPLEIENSYGGTPLGQALWSAAHDRDLERYLSTIELLLRAGSVLPAGHKSISSTLDPLLARAITLSNQ